MTKSTGGEEARAPAERQAAEWIVVLSDPSLDHATRADLRAQRDAWLSEAPEHAACFREVDRIWRLLREAAVAAGTLQPAAEARPPQGAQEVGAQEVGAQEPERGADAWRRRRLFRWFALVLALGLLLGFARFWFGDPALLLAADVRTAPGEQRRVELAGGARLLIGSDSAVVIDPPAAAPEAAQGDADGGAARDGAGAATPRVRLLGGSVAIATEATEGERLPAVVSARGVELQGRGFQVTAGGQALSVTATEGLVRVAFPGRPERSPVVLGPGERLTLAEPEATEILETVDLELATAWQHGRLVFRNAPLFEVVAALNRHRRGAIVIADAALGGRSVTASFRLDDPSGAASRLAEALGAARLSLPPFVTLLY